jgi:acetoin utilization deacetylase AcuC-like enzyme
VDYKFVWDSLVTPLLEQYQPELIIVAAGFDAGEWDRDIAVGGYSLTDRAYCQFVKKLRNYCISGFSLHTATQPDRTEHPGLIFCLEGGYSVDGMAECVSKMMSVLLDEHDTSCIPDSPCGAGVSAAVCPDASETEITDTVHPDVKSAVEEVKAVLGPYWSL